MAEAVIPGEPHGLLEGPRRTALPFDVAGAEPGAEVRLGEAVLRVLAHGSDASARGFLLLPGGLLFTGAAPWAPAALPREAQWLAPALGFLQRAAER